MVVKTVLLAGDSMNFAFEKPYAFYGLLVLIPALIFVFVRYRRMVTSLGLNQTLSLNGSLLLQFKRRFILRTICRSLAWITLVFAYSGMSWGTNMVPVQKSGNAVSFVFDISYSMEAKDAPDGMTRLTAATNYAEELLNRMTGVSVSVVLAKGDGVVAIPLTEDTESIKSLLDVLSPELMTSQGTSIGKGIEASISSFPQQSAQAAHIWVFTDGEETDGMLASALAESVKFGIPVSLIGFGSELETEILAGDGKTNVKTALRSDAIKKIAASVEKKSAGGKSHLSSPVTYVDASEVGSAYRLLRSLQTDTILMRDQNVGDEHGVVTYELQPVKRQKIFISLTLLFFILSFVLGEFSIARGKRMQRLNQIGLIAISALMFTGCSSRVRGETKILQGKLEWNNKNYQQAVTYFLQATEEAHSNSNRNVGEYALYGLAVTYLMQDENDAALERFDQISPDAPEAVRFAVLYNSGIIAHQKGDYRRAASFFKDALRVDSSNVNAKINLELSLQQEAVQTNTTESQMTPVEENKDTESVESAVYSIVRENDQNKWKNSEQKTETSSRDY